MRIQTMSQNMSRRTYESIPHCAKSLHHLQNTKGLWVISTAFILVIAGSHIGMLWLANHFLISGTRSELAVSPEQITGILAAFLLVVHFFSDRRAYIWGGVTTSVLVAFCGFCIVGEILRPDIRIENLSTFLSFVVSYFIGIGLAPYFVQQTLVRLIFRFLILIYVIWYLGLAFFMLRGDLGFFSQLEGAFNIDRLAFRLGFAATEIPMWIGLHTSILLFLIKGRFDAPTTFLCGLLVCVGTLVVFLTASVAAMIAFAIVFYVMISKRNVIKLKGFIGIVIIGYPAIIIFNGITNNDFSISVLSKIQHLLAGDGARGAAYDYLVYLIQNYPFGIGKGRFVESNNFGWTGDGIYPHNNYLGIGAEMGWLALALYVFFIFSFLMKIGAGIDFFYKKEVLAANILKAVIAIFIFQQFRGMLHDTWILKELYLWAGLGVGLISAYSRTPEMARPRQSNPQ